MNVEASAIVARMVSEFGYTEKEAQETVPKLFACDPRVQQAFEKWWRGEDQGEQLQVRGYTAQRLMERRGFKPTPAFLMLDWLLRDPEVAMRALKEGFDHMVFTRDEDGDGQEQGSVPTEEVTDADLSRAQVEATIAIVEAWGKEGLIQPSEAATLLTTLRTIRQRLIEDLDFEDAMSLVEGLPPGEREILEKVAEEAIMEYNYFLPANKKG